jgi:ribonuclease PH
MKKLFLAILLLISSQRQCSSQSVFESALFVEKYPRAEIRITIHVMQVFIQLLLPAAARPACSILHPKSHVNQIDGSVRCACINAASMALISAGIEMRDTVCACSAGQKGRGAQTWGERLHVASTSETPFLQPYANTAVYAG